MLTSFALSVKPDVVSGRVERAGSFGEGDSLDGSPHPTRACMAWDASPVDSCSVASTPSRLSSASRTRRRQVAAAKVPPAKSSSRGTRLRVRDLLDDSASTCASESALGSGAAGCVAKVAVASWAAALTKSVAQRALAGGGLQAAGLPLKCASMLPTSFLQAGSSLGAPLAASVGAGAPATAGVAAAGAAAAGGHSLEAVVEELQTHVGLLSLSSAVMFIGSIRGLNQHRTAKQGCGMGMVATGVGLASVIFSPAFAAQSSLGRFAVPFALGGGLGLYAATEVEMEHMPQLVAGFHSFVGLAAVLTGLAAHFSAVGAPGLLHSLEMFAGVSVGALTFTGSVVAAGKLHGAIDGRPLQSAWRWPLNFAGTAALAGLAVAFAAPHLAGAGAHDGLRTGALLLNAAISGGLGVNMVMPVGGADMPIIVSLLNSFSGIAMSAAGFMLGNNLLTITGALVCSSGALLSDVMCRGINRSLFNVLLGGFGGEGGGNLSAVRDGRTAGDCVQLSAAGVAEQLLHRSKRVLIVPGFGIAQAKCTSRLRDVAVALRAAGVEVSFGIHPVAGRLPGHMNILLAEVALPTDIVMEMDDVNPQMEQYDTVLVVGANDIVNPSTQSDVSSPIYGMPTIEVWRAKRVIVMKRSLGYGYSQVDNPLFFESNTAMLFGDGRASLDVVYATLQAELADRDDAVGDVERPAVTSLVEQLEAICRSEAPRVQPLSEIRDLPATRFTLGVLRDVDPHETRVAVVPAALEQLRRAGFSVKLQAGAGAAAGFSDSDYQTVDSRLEVLSEAGEVFSRCDVVLKVGRPTLDEVKRVRHGQTLCSAFSMYAAADLEEAMLASEGNFVNLNLVPRQARAQKMDSLSSMANIAGYRATLHAFSKLPRLARSAATAAGSIAPAKVFVIGAGVAGLSAITTAKNLGATVLATDVREAAKEQVLSMDAHWVSVEVTEADRDEARRQQGLSHAKAAVNDESADAKNAGEGVGGYASETSLAYTVAQRRVFSEVLSRCDIVITTALIPNRRAPLMLTREVVASMKPGGVVMDLAACMGGNCELSRPDEDIVDEDSGVHICGESRFAQMMPQQTSELLSQNWAHLLDHLFVASEDGSLTLNVEDSIIDHVLVARDGQFRWPRPPAPVSAVKDSDAGAPADAGAALDEALDAVNAYEIPPTVKAVLSFMRENREHLAMALGTGVVLALGLGTDVPEQELMQLGYFVLSLLIGHFTVASVTPALHTPLIAVTNAISGIMVVGSMLQLSGPVLSAKVACSLLGVFFSSANIVGGFAVTHRMLNMFDQPQARSAAGSK